MFVGMERYTFSWRNADPFIIILGITLLIIGLAQVLSATYKTDAPLSSFFIKQFFGIISGIVLGKIVAQSDWRKIEEWGTVLFGITIILLLFTLFLGTRAMGAHRWIDLKIIRFQPSELAKFALPAALITYLRNGHESEKNFYFFIPPLLLIMLSAILIMKQPDLGTAVLVTTGGLIILWLAGLSARFFIISALIALAATPILWHTLHPYQKKRIAVFLGEGDPKKERYHIEQSKIAIGSGGIMGKGFLRGTQHALHYLPEARTDFIFAVLCEEWGFFGACIVILLYTALYARMFILARSIRDIYAQTIAATLTAQCAVATLINMGMVMGMMPVVGIPLPLMSYGVSNMWIILISIGWYLSIIMHRA
jgi:rod shape determining protein RodA